MSTRAILLTLTLAFSFYTVYVYRFSDMRESSRPTAAAESGKRIWHEKNCQSCHQIYGLGGYMGPELTNVAKKGPEYIRAFIQRGTRRMPDFHLSEREMQDLVAFLGWVDASGQSRVPDSAVHWTGTYLIAP